MIKIFFLSIAFLMTSVTTVLAAPSPTDVLKQFLPLEHKLLDHKKGDINGDGIADYVLILKEHREDQAGGPDDIMYYRPLILVLGQPNGTLKQALRNDDVIMCKACVDEDEPGEPYKSTEINPKTGAMTFSFQGGSTKKWAVSYTFTYKPELKKWLLTEESGMNFSSTAPQSKKEYLVKEAEFLEPVSLEFFDFSTIREAQDTTPWVVTAERAYFFDSPDPQSPPQKDHLVKGHLCRPIRETKNFILCAYSDPKSIKSGFILKKDMQKKSGQDNVKQP